MKIQRMSKRNEECSDRQKVYSERVKGETQSRVTVEQSKKMGKRE